MRGQDQTNKKSACRAHRPAGCGAANPAAASASPSAGADVSSPPPARPEDQVASVRKVWVHAEFVRLVNPHIEGKGDDETPFAARLLRCVFGRHPGFRPPEVEVHTEGPDRIRRQSSEYPEAVRRLRANVAQDLPRAVPRGRRVRLVIWEKLLERVLVAGTFVPRSSGPAHAPRFGVHMGHVARAADRRTGDQHDWHLVSDERLGELYRKYANRTGPNSVEEVVIDGAG